MWSWRSRSPKLETRKVTRITQSESEGPRTRRPSVLSRRRGRPSSRRERIHPSSAFLFCLGPQRIGGCPVYSGEGTGSSLPSLLTQMLISSRNSLTDTPRNNVLLAISVSLSPDSLTHKINRHICVSRRYKELSKAENKKTNNPTKKWANI